MTCVWVCVCAFVEGTLSWIVSKGKQKKVRHAHVYPFLSQEEDFNDEEMMATFAAKLQVRMWRLFGQLTQLLVVYW